MKIFRTILFICFLLVILSTSTKLYSQLSGAYTIGAGGNYATITAAVADLVLNGVNGPVVFNIKTGSYDEFFTVDSVAGSSSVNTVTFKSQTGIAADVTLYTSSASLFTMSLRGADFIIIRDLTFNSFFTGIPGKRRIRFEGFCDNALITGNKFLGGMFDAGIGSLNATINNLVVDANIFQLSTGVFMQQPTIERSLNTKITNNDFICRNGIALARHDGLVIEKNILRIASVDFAGNYAIYIGDCNGVLRILKNRISYYNSSDNATDGIRIDPYTGPDALIANNFISIGSGNGMILGDCNNMKVFYNTVYCSQTRSGNIAIGASQNMTLRNNIYVQLVNASDLTLTLYIATSSINSNYNDFYYFSEHMLQYNAIGYIDSLPQFQLLTGQDLNSVERQVFFVSPPDLHLAGSSIGDEDLAGIPLAEVTDDIDGMPRSAVHPYMGADEADIPLPVELSSFTSIVNERNVTLDWATVSEMNSSGFEIERSNITGQTSAEWMKIGFTNGHGSTNNLNIYNFSDRNLISGKYNYRLKQIDFNESFEYFNLSNEVVIGIPEKFSLSQNYPNPFNPNTVINFEIPSNIKGQLSDVKLTVFNSLGKEVATLVNEKLEAGYHNVKFDGSVFSSGIYFYTLQSENFRETKRMILIK